MTAARLRLSPFSAIGRRRPAESRRRSAAGAREWAHLPSYSSIHPEPLVTLGSPFNAPAKRAPVRAFAAKESTPCTSLQFVHFAEVAREKADALHRSPGGLFVGAMLAGSYIGIAMILALSVAAGAPGRRATARHRRRVRRRAHSHRVCRGGAFHRLCHVSELRPGPPARHLVRGDSPDRGHLDRQSGRRADSLQPVRCGRRRHDLHPQPTICTPMSPTRWIRARSPCWPARCCATGWSASPCGRRPASRAMPPSASSSAGCCWPFVGPGFEHSIANMTSLTLGLLVPDPSIDLAGAIRNVVLVTAGNIIGGAVFVVAPISPPRRPIATAPPQHDAGPLPTALRGSREGDAPAQPAPAATIARAS